jgi:hypothetical protein
MDRAAKVWLQGFEHVTVRGFIAPLNRRRRRDGKG